MHLKRSILYDFVRKRGDSYKNMMYVSINNNDCVFVKFNDDLKSESIIKLNRHSVKNVKLSERQFKILKFIK